MSKLLTALSSFLLATIVMTTEAGQKDRIKYISCSVTGSVEDNLMSDDMAEYIVKYGKGSDFSESEME
jgi:hypothetical protein